MQMHFSKYFFFIFGKKKREYLTGIPESRMAFAVPPDAARRSPRALRRFAKPTRPCLLDTLRRAANNRLFYHIGHIIL